MKKINNKKIIYIIIGILFLIILIIFEFFKNNNSNEVIDIEQINNTVSANEISELNSRTIIVHITGCVKKEGIIEIEENSRIIDAINAAGGITEDADISKINLAYILKDAQKIYIPSIYDSEEIGYITTNSGYNVIIEDNYGGNNVMININTASQTELEQLPGIGTSTALKIINYKNEHGNFKSIDEIKNVPGIGNAKYENIKDMICI